VYALVRAAVNEREVHEPTQEVEVVV
jgi:hypothetical protein